MQTWVWPGDGCVCHIGSLDLTHEGGGGLDGIHMLVEMFWKGPFRGADHFSTIFMLENVVFSVQQLLGGGDVHVDIDPVHGRAI
jgi:hypothetical protein